MDYRPLDTRPGQPPMWSQIAMRLRAAIDSGELTETLPSENEMMARWGVARQTVRQGVRVLIDAGLVAPVRGKAAFIVSPVDPHAVVRDVLAAAKLKRAEKLATEVVAALRDNGLIN